MPESKYLATVNVSDDREKATIEFLPASGIDGGLTLNFDQLTDIITILGAARRIMAADKPVPLLDGQNIQGIFNTRWFVQMDTLTQHSCLTFYHPAFGPVGFVMPREQVMKIVRLLSNHLRVRSPSGDNRPN